MNIRFLPFLLLIVLNSFISIAQSQNDIHIFKDSIKQLSFKEIQKVYMMHFETDSLRMEAIIEEFFSDLKASKFDDFETMRIYQSTYFWKYKTNDVYACIEYANLASNAATKAGNNHSLSLAINMKAACYSQLGDHELAAKNFKEALEIAKESNNDFMRVAINSNFGEMKIESKDLKGGIEVIESTIKEIKEKKLKRAELFFDSLYSILSRAYLEAGDIAMAKHYNCLGRESELKTPAITMYLSLLDEANIEIYEKNYDSALKTLREFEKKEGRSKYVEIDALIHLYRGRAFYLKGDYLKGIEELLKLEEFKNKYIFDRLSFQESYSILAKCYRALNREKESMKYWDKALSVYSENELTRIKMIADIKETFDNERFLKEIEKKNLIASKGNYEKYTSIKAEIKKMEKEKQKSDSLMVSLIFALTVILIITGIYFHRKKKSNVRKFEKLMTELIESKEKPIANVKSSSDLKEETVASIIKGLKKLEAKEYFLKNECNTINVAKKLKTNTTYLSKVISLQYQYNFKTYLNSLRINYVVSRLKHDTVFRSYSIQAIAEEIGYKSTGSFLKAFKKHTGILPSYYIKKLN